MSAILEILSNINARRNKAANPVIFEAVDIMLDKLSSSTFEPEQDLDIILAPLPKRFTTSAFSRMAWSLDIMLKNDLKRAANSLNTKFDPANRLESFGDIANELDDLWGSEANSYEVGFEDSGILHRIAAVMNIRLAYHENAETQMRSQRKPYEVKSIEAQIGNPERQKISGHELANFRFEALADAHLESNQTERLAFDNAVIWTNEIIEKSKVVANLESMKITRDAKGTKEQIDLDNAMARIEELSKMLENVSDSVRAALSVYCKFVSNKQALLDKWYQDKLNMIPVMLTIRDFCTRRVADDKLTFNELPVAVQVHLLTHISASLDQTMGNMTSQAPELYRDYKASVVALKVWLNEAIDARLEGVDETTGHAQVRLTPDEEEAALARSDARRAKHARLDD